MDNNEIKDVRKQFNYNIMKFFYEKHTMEYKDYENILKMTIKEAKISEESSDKIYVYMGSYRMLNGRAILTYNNDKELVYKKYKDIETGNSITVNKSSIDAFEKENKVIFSIVTDYTEEEYIKTYDFIKYVYFKELLSTDKEDAYKLIKRLTPNK